MIIDIDNEEFDANDQYWPGWCFWCGDPDYVCQCGDTRPEDVEMDEWSDDDDDDW